MPRCRERSESFFEPTDTDGLFESTELTRGPWDPGAQHAGPPAALIAREIERLGGGRIGGADGLDGAGRAHHLRGHAPGADRAAFASPPRSYGPGAASRWSERRLTDEAGNGADPRPGLADQDGGGRRSTTRRDCPRRPRRRTEAEPGEFFPTGHEVGYHSAMDYRFLTGGFLEAGPATVWMRPRVALVAGEEVTPLQRVLVAADSGNGVSAALDWKRYLFINVDLSVHLHRMPEGEWVCLDAITLPEPDGVGMADSALFDERGPIGRAVQTLLVDER